MTLAAITGWDLLVAVSVLLTVCSVAVVVIAVFAIRNAERIEDDRGPAWPAECICGRVMAAGGPDHHIVTATFDDDAQLAGGAIGSTGMSADFCPQHCPGGCNLGCPVLRAVP